MTSRNVPAGMKTALDSPHFTGFVFVELYLDAGDGGTQYLTSCPHDVDYGGNTYITAWGVSSVSAIVEDGSTIEGLRMSLSHVSVANISSALSLKVQGRRAVVRFAVVTAGVLYVDPNTWSGKIDTLNLADGPQEGEIVLTAEHDLATWETPNVRRFSHAEQQRIAPSDMFFEYAAQISKRAIVWPSKEFFKV